MEERGSAILLFFNFWVQYYHSTLSKNHARLFSRLTMDFFYRNSCQGIKFFEKNVSQSIYRRKGRHRFTPDSWSPTLHVLLFYCSLLTVIRLLNPSRKGLSFMPYHSDFMFLHCCLTSSIIITIIIL